MLQLNSPAWISRHNHQRYNHLHFDAHQYPRVLEYPPEFQRRSLRLTIRNHANQYPQVLEYPP
jgi:hypothetical protein